MIILSRSVNDGIIVGEDFAITILAIRGEKVRMSVEAIHRLETHVGQDPTRVTLLRFDSNLYQRFFAHPEELCKLTSDQFEVLVADRLAAMGFGVKLTGLTNRIDGGINFLAWPEFATPFPYLLAGQVELHGTTNRRVAAGDARDFLAAISCHGATFQLGILVTNAEFIADANWATAQSRNVVGFRDLTDLSRWMRDDLSDVNEWREVPNEIQLAPGIVIPLPWRHQTFVQ